MNAVESCPQCGGRVTNSMTMSGEYVSASCSRCGWDSERRPEIYSRDEALDKVIEASRELLRVVHRSDECFARDSMYRTRAEELRQEAERIENRDARIRRLQWAFACLDTFQDAAAQREP